MKKTLLKLNFFCAVVLLSFQSINAQTTVNVNPAATWLGYANVYELGGAFVFASAWGVPDIKSVPSVQNNSVTLYPNYNTYNASDPFWANGAEGNKIFEGSTFTETVNAVSQVYTFTGFVSSNTIVSEYEVLAFIKVLDPNNNYALVDFYTTTLPEGQDFTIVTPTEVAPQLLVQCGFSVTGINANPVDEAANGNVVVIPANLSVNTFETANIKVYPNPTSSTITVDSANVIDNIAIINSLGQRVLTVSPASSSATIDVSSFQSGLYFVKTTIEGKVSVSKVVKN